MFIETIFAKDVSLNHATFTQDARFHGARFAQHAVFMGVTFTGFTYFANAHFLAGDDDAFPSFQNAQFEKPTTFREAKFLHLYPDFSGAVLHDRTTFTAKEELWPADLPPDLEAARESCATIRHLLGRQGFPEEEHFFYRREMDLTSANSTGWQRVLYWIFKTFSNYGHSIQRPAWSLLFLWGLGVVSLWGYFAMERAEDVVRPLGTAMGLSFSQLFPAFGFSRLYFGAAFIQSVPAPLQIMGAAQTVLSLPLLFFLGLGLRTRFRLR